MTKEAVVAGATGAGGRVGGDAVAGHRRQSSSAACRPLQRLEASVEEVAASRPQVRATVRHEP